MGITDNEDPKVNGHQQHKPSLDSIPIRSISFPTCIWDVLTGIPWSGFLISRLLVVHQFLMVLTGQPASGPNRPAPYSRLPHALTTLSPMCPIASPSLYLRFPVSFNPYWGYTPRPSCCRGSGNGGVCRAGSQFE